MVNDNRIDDAAYLVARNGCLLISDTDAHTGRFYAFVVQADTVINKVYQTNVVLTLDNTEKGDVSAKTLYAGTYVSAGGGDGMETWFNSIQLTSGSVIAYYL